MIFVIENHIFQCTIICIHQKKLVNELHPHQSLTSQWIEVKMEKPSQKKQSVNKMADFYNGNTKMENENENKNKVVPWEWIV